MVVGLFVTAPKVKVELIGITSGMVLVIPPKDSTGTVPSPNNVVSRVLELVNQQRSGAGLAPLTLNSQLTAAAQGHSQDTPFFVNRIFIKFNGEGRNFIGGSDRPPWRLS